MPSARPAPREVELKLGIPDGSGALISRMLQAHAQSAPRQRYEVTTYFDTPERALAEAGASLRVRAAGDRHIQTVKAAGRTAVAADRAEWEWPVSGDEPDVSLLRETVVSRALPDGAGLLPAFRTEIHRATWRLDLDGAAVEAALDEGRITAGDAGCAVRELELELRDGEPLAVFRLALRLHAAVPLHIEPLSKASRGWLLTDNARPKAVKADMVRLHPAIPIGTAFRDIVSVQLGHLLANRPAALAGDAEGVHQMRVAVRRLRTALALFKPHLEPHALSAFEQELRGLGQALGVARDWDVFCLHLLPGTLDGPANAASRAMLAAPAEAARSTARRRGMDAVQASGFTALVLGLAAWAEAAAASADPTLQRPIGRAGANLLDRLARKVARRGRRLARRSDLERHALRRALKKLRYGVDFLRPVLPAKRAKRFLKRCRKLQKTLGAINDTVAGTALADALIAQGGIGLAPAIDVLAAELTRRRKAALPRLHRRWARFGNELDR